MIFLCKKIVLDEKQKEIYLKGDFNYEK